MKGRRTWWLLLAVAAGLVSADSPRPGRAQDARTGPAPEMERLSKLYLGTWDYTETYPKSAFYPNGGVNTGVYTSEAGPGGRSILNRFHSRGPAGDSEGMLVMTWDLNEKVYKSYVFGNGFPGCIIETGQFEGGALTYRTELAAEGMKMKLRNVTKLETSGKLSSEAYMAAEGAPETLLVHVEATRRPGP
jgi:hypothetical protein